MTKLGHGGEHVNVQTLTSVHVSQPSTLLPWWYESAADVLIVVFTLNLNSLSIKKAVKLLSNILYISRVKNIK